MSKKEDKKNEPLDYYKILELDKKCTKADIDNAYRRLAIRWHPDKNKDNVQLAEKKFREISNAYQVLSDETARKNYDRHGAVSNGTSNMFDPYEMFKGIFDTDDNKIPDVIIKIEADIHKLYTGFTESVKFSRFSQCETCEATGTRDCVDANCASCKGRGIIMETVKGGKIGYMINEKTCTVCDGKGVDPGVKLCKKCKGQKYTKEDIECDVDVPPGAYENYFIKLEDEGNFIPEDERRTNKKKERTDVIVVIKEKNPNDCIFRRGMFIQEINRVNLADVLMTVDIEFGESLVGVKRNLEYIAGDTVGIEIDDVVQNGDIHVIKNKGMPLVPEELEKVKHLGKKAQDRGDLFIRFKVERPKISKQKRNRLWQIITDTPYPETQDVDEVSQSIMIEEYISEKKKDIKIQNSGLDDTPSQSNSESDDESSFIDSDRQENSDDSDNASDESSDSEQPSPKNRKTTMQDRHRSKHR